MLQFLQEWLKMRTGAAPVSVRMQGQSHYARMIMFGVDEIGIVLADAKDPDTRNACPWHAVGTVVPDHSK